MFFNGHNPPHFHANYGEHKAEPMGGKRESVKPSGNGRLFFRRSGVSGSSPLALLGMVEPSATVKLAQRLRREKAVSLKGSKSAKGEDCPLSLYPSIDLGSFSARDEEASWDMQPKIRHHTAVFRSTVVLHGLDVSESPLAHASIGRTIARLRTEAHLTQERLAELAGIDTRSLQRVEAGEWNISVDYLDRLRGALRCRWADLIRDLD